jgi:Tfp pilus assembly major pilin PilA
MNVKKIILLAGASLVIFGCKNNDTATTASDIEETAQQVGDMMASVDEAGRGTTAIAFDQNLQNSIEKTFANYGFSQNKTNLWSQLIFIPTAQATSCSASAYNCNGAGVVTRDFAGCTTGVATFTGTSTLTWSNLSASCTMTAAGESITHVPDITATGLRGATLRITKSGTVGQKLTWASGTGMSRVLNYSNDGIRRVFTAGSSTLFDMTAITTSDLVITGTDRSSRIINSGALLVTNNLNAINCSYVPSNVTWSSVSCNCPVSGSWTGTCSDGRNTTLNITGCGTATYTDGISTVGLNLYRCGS